jgi:hypothetical protein
MKVSHILCAVLACAPLTFEARAAASSEAARPSRAAAGAGQPAGRTAPSRDAGAKPQGTRDREPIEARARTGGGSTGGVSKGRDPARDVPARRGSIPPQRGDVQARSNADRLHSLLNAKAHARLARQPVRPVGSIRAATGGAGVQGPRGVAPTAQARPSSVNSAASPAARPAASPRNSPIGGPHAQVFGRVGGPAIGRTTHSATVDGTQLHHK